MLARLLQFTTLSTIACSLAWLGIVWGQSQSLAFAGFLVVLLFPAPVIGLQFLALNGLNSRDPVPPASISQLLNAWWGEVIQVFKVFYWRQPYSWNAIPDASSGPPAYAGHRGVVFIHGFICNRGIWTPWLREVEKSQRAFAAVNLEPVFGRVDDYVPIIEQAITQIIATTGQPPLIICHSMGGLAIRAWLRSRLGNDARVHHIVTIGTPHHGTWLGRMAFTPNGMQMRLASRWLSTLEADEPPQRHRLFTCYFSNCDNIVFPASTATLAGADNRLILGKAHVALAFDARVMRESLAML